MFPGVPPHVLHRNSTGVCSGSGQEEQIKGYVIPALLKSLPATVLVYVCCPSMITNSALSDFPSASQFRRQSQ